MLNPFPIQFLALFAYFLLRLCVGGILIYLGLLHHKHRRELKEVLVVSWFPFGNFTARAFAFGEILIGTLFVLGAFTQIAALLTMAMCIKLLLLRHWFDHPTIPQKLFYLLLFAAALSLFITGAGALAFDLPI